MWDTNVNMAAVTSRENTLHFYFIRDVLRMSASLPVVYDEAFRFHQNSSLTIHSKAEATGFESTSRHIISLNVAVE